MQSIAIHRTALLDPADSLTYRAGVNGLVPSTVFADIQPFVMTKGGILQQAHIIVRVTGTLGTGEVIAMRVRNDTTSATRVVGTDAAWDAAVVAINEQLINGLAYSAGDEMGIEFVCPAWTTNPTQVSLEGVLVFNSGYAKHGMLRV